MSAKGSILVIDDESEIRESLEQLLELEGYKADSAATGEEGLRRIENGLFDLVLLDINLPDRNGLDLLQQIKRDSPEVRRHHDHGLCVHPDGFPGFQAGRG